MQFHITKKSTNRKTGPIPVSTSPKQTCPKNCPLKDGGGCYAGGGPLNIHWNKVSSGERGLSWREFCGEIAHCIPRGTLWRHNQAGDLVPQVGKDKIASTPLEQLVGANSNRKCKGFTYTHYPVLTTSKQDTWNRAVISWANENGFTINLSGDSPVHADELADLEIAPVTTHLYSTAENHATLETPQGRKIVVCPAVRKADKSCANCGLCQKADRDYIIGFPAHGAKTRYMDRLIASMEEG